MNQRRHGVKTIFTALRLVMRFFAGFILMIVGIVGWRRLWIEGKAISALEYGEIVSLGILLAIAVGLLLFSYRIKGEIDKV
ncbi:MAG: hypothetical protein HKN11_07200 [Rhizobiales bacterium]|nr:hypothetical protein [Hyphomicrobiales bacterium]